MSTEVIAFGILVIFCLVLLGCLLATNGRTVPRVPRLARHSMACTLMPEDLGKWVELPGSMNMGQLISITPANASPHLGNPNDIVLALRTGVPGQYTTTKLVRANPWDHVAIYDQETK